EASPPGVSFMVSYKHPSFSGCDGLSCVEAKCAGFRVTSDALAVIRRRERMRSILNQMKPVPSRNSMDTGKIAWFSTDMNCQDGFRSRRYARLKVGRIEVEAAREGIAKHRAGPKVSNDRGTGSKRIGGNEDFISPANTNRIKPELKCRCARIHCQGVSASDIGREVMFKLLCRRPGCKPPGCKHFRYCI